MARSTADTKERSPVQTVQSTCRVVTSVTHDSQSPLGNCFWISQIRSDTVRGLAFLSAPLRRACTTAVQIDPLALLASCSIHLLQHLRGPLHLLPRSPSEEQHLLQWVTTPHTKSPPHPIQCFTLSDKMCQRLLPSSTNLDSTPISTVKTTVTDDVREGLGGFRK